MLEERQFRTPEPDRNQCGAVIVMVALLLVVFVGFAAMAIDIGHLLVVRNELQNAADAAALAGAASLVPQTPPASPAPPAWAMAATVAAGSIGLNKSENAALADCEVSTGYWNYDHSPSGLQGTAITPKARDFPAVRVAVRRGEGNNGGPVKNWFASILGIGTSDVAAAATAVMTTPGQAEEGVLFPLVINKALAERASFHNTYAGRFKITNEHHTDGINGSYWTTFFQNNNSNRYVKDLIDPGSGVDAPALGIGEVIQIDPGVRAVDYQLTLDHWKNEVVKVAVVQTLDGNSQQPVVGFVCLYITDVHKKGAHSYIEAYFAPNCYAGGTGGVGPNYGAYAPPTLVQ